MRRAVTAIAALVAAVVAATTFAAPAQAAVRTLVQVTNGWCVRQISNYPDLRSCSTAPTSARNWTFVNKGTYNGHQLWAFKNASTGKCIDSAPLMVTCSANSNYEKWEVFYVNTASGRRMALKNLGAALHRGSHVCMTFRNPAGAAGNLLLRPCNIYDSLQQFRP
ncbi:hypothetical protein [Paractinoplanes rishiriensis]|uniref:Ricin B lectin domain-containing protein n=1 Tax=Paractinoplanes rishiriensis TaxID=1050105 RepID=A0A919K628_9ACTN|nr:hypothetical protein [Actinoplanes rishiriensis]GIF01597.1 hypothetical protein Ari01nite_90610 [Actinoplanes rishiriensis]